MSDFEEKLNAILSNPDALAQVANLAQSLNLSGAFGGDGQNGGQGEPPPPSSSPTASQRSPSGGNPGGPDLSGLGGLGGLGDLAGLSNLLGQIDPKTIQRLLPLVSELTDSGANDERMQLLYALRPFLKPERRDKVERATQAAKLIHVGKKLLATMGDSYV